MIQNLVFQFRELTVEVIYKPIKHCYLRIRSDGHVEISSSQHKKPAELEDLIRRYYPKLKQKLNKIQAVLPKKITPEANLSLLGVNYPIQQQIGLTADNSIRIVDGRCKISLCSATALEKQKILIEKFYQQTAAKLFPEFLQQRFSYFAELGYSLPRLSIKTMRTRWGSYSLQTHRIHLNRSLIQLEQSLIDYVVVHELCHLVEQNHSLRFYALMSKFLPNWRELRAKLNQFSHILN